MGPLPVKSIRSLNTGTTNRNAVLACLGIEIVHHRNHGITLSHNLTRYLVPLADLNQFLPLLSLSSCSPSLGLGAFYFRLWGRFRFVLD